MSIFRSSTFAWLPLTISFIAALESPSVSAAAAQNALELVESRSPLVEKVRAATEKYQDVHTATSDGFVQATPCVSGPDMGAMGIHYLRTDRITNGVLDVEEPEALIYEPQPDGALRLVGVEYIVFASIWATLHPNAGPPALEGDLLNFIDAPNRYDLPALFEMHVWAWEANPRGSFADWNTHVTCAKQAAP
jgi:hypothetical protein